MNKQLTSLLGAVLFVISVIGAQAQTANDFIQPYDEPFRPGINLGYFPGLSNENLADLAGGNAANNVQGLGAKSIRTGIFNEFVEVWGYDFLEETYDYFDDRGLKENTVIVGFPAAWQRDQTFHCPGQQSTMFANLYDPIFDNGENGTPVNDNNFLALYLYRLVTQYQDHVRFWEIWNEPGSDLPTGFQVGWREPGFPGNWWENNPDPCDNILHAPVTHYVRTLRIAYEVIKSVDPDAYVSVAGFGYPAFLDAVLRNTDNPVDGSPTAEYPLGGGAYFDVFGNHAYPHFDGTTTNFSEGRFERHSDVAADGIVTRRVEFEEVLANYGYDGNTYPLKPSIITEMNIPRKRFGDNIGGIDVQTNYIIKAFIKAKTNDVYVIHPYNMIEEDDFETAGSEFGVMGMYERFDTPGEQVPTGEAIAYKTTSDLLYNTTYDEARTAAMQVPAGLRGHAFQTPDGEYIYALWAETTIDLSEAASGVYSFPANFNLGNLELIEWDYSQTSVRGAISGTNIPLDARPIFLTASSGTPPPPPPPPPTTNPPTSSDGPNLALSLTSLDNQPGIYNTTTLVLTVENYGNQAAGATKINMPLAAGQLAYTGHTQDAGSYFNWNGDWDIPAIPAGATYTLSIDVFTLSAEAINIFAEVTQQDYVDSDSSPNNGTCCVPVEDDEAFVALNASDSGCICTTEVAPVCGSDGQVYSNACLAVCAGITDYTAGDCTVAPPPPPPPSNTDGMDLTLEMMVDKPNFSIYETVTFSFVVRNEGNVMAENIQLQLKGFNDNLAYGSHTVSDGAYFDWVGEWNIPNIPAGGAATLSLGLFTLQDAASQTIFAQVVSASPTDSDSTPNNNAGTTPAEDDEAAITIVPSNNLNGNTAEFRALEDRTSSYVIQQLMPNPATDILNIRIFSKKETAANLKVLNPQGQLMIQQKESVKEGVNIAQIRVDELSSGIYYILLEGTGGRLTPLKFVKQRL